MAESCTKIWRDSLESDCARIVRESTEKLRVHIKDRADDREDKKQKLEELQCDLTKLKGHYDDLRNSTLKGSRVPKELDEQFDKDVEKVVELGQVRARELWERFNDRVTEVSTRQYGLQDFQRDVDEFLKSCSSDLERRFENAQFSSMQSKYVDHLMEMSSMYGWLVSTAEKLCGIAPTAPSSSTEHATDSTDKEAEQGLEDVIAQKPPDLKHLKDQIGSIEPLLSRWKKFWRKVLTFFHVRHNDLSKKHLSDLSAKLRDEIANECQKYFADIRAEVVQYFFRKYCSKTEAKLQEYDGKFGQMVDLKRSNMEKMQQFLVDCQQAIDVYQKWCEHLHAVEVKVHEQAY